MCAWERCGFDTNDIDEKSAHTIESYVGGFGSDGWIGRKVVRG